MLSIETCANIGVNTLMLASMYILASMGFAFIFNMLGTINLAHGSIYMIGAYLTYAFLAKVGLPIWLSILCSAIVLAAFGLLVERFGIRPFITDFSRIVMVGVALMTALTTAATIISGTKTLSVDSVATGSIDLGIVSISKEKLIIFIVGVVLVVLVLLMVNKTKIGREMKAVAQDRVGAALMGISINRISAIVCVIGCGIAALAGGLMASYGGLSVTMGDTINLRILMLVMLAGAGSMNGIVITGLVMAFLDALLPVLFQGTFSSALALFVVIVLLLIKPKGFFGHEM